MTELRDDWQPRVLIVGAGFGGLACARALDGKPVEVLLIDRHNYHLFTPLLYQVGTGLLNPSDIAYPLRRVFRNSHNVRVRQATVRQVDLSAKFVRTEDDQTLNYDFIVLATGSVDNYFGNQRLADVSLGLKSLEDATRLRNHVLTCLERADAETDELANADDVRAEVESLLASHEKAGDFIAHPVLREYFIGEHLGHWKIVADIGEGGMSVKRIGLMGLVVALCGLGGAHAQAPTPPPDGSEVLPQYTPSSAEGPSPYAASGPYAPASPSAVGAGPFPPSPGGAPRDQQAPIILGLPSSPWLVYPSSPCCCGAVGTCGGPIGSELFVRSGMTFPLGGGFFGAHLNPGWAVEGGGRSETREAEGERTAQTASTRTPLHGRSHRRPAAGERCPPMPTPV